jgi:hypothetical protein
MSAELNARRWLRYDAVYCGGAGLVAVLLAVPLSRLFHVPAALIVALGAATAVWAWLLARIGQRDDWRRQVRFVGTANAFASAGVVALAVVAPGTAARVLLGAVAAEVAAFAAVQLRLLR